MTAGASVASSSVRRARLAVTTVFALNGLAMASWTSRIPAERDALHLSTSRIGLVLLVMSGGAVLALPSTGAVVERLGPSRTVRLASVVCTGGLAVASLAGSVGPLVAGLFFFGLGTGAWDVAMNVEGAEVEREHGRSIMPHFHAAYSVGTVVGALVGAVTNAVDLSTPGHLIAIAVVSVTGTQLACGTFLSVGRHAGGPVAVASDGDPMSSPAPRRNPLAAWAEPRTIAIGLLVLTFAFTEGSANDWLGLAFVDGYHVSNAVGVLGFAVFVTAMTTGRLLGTRLLDRFGRVTTLRLTAVSAAAGLLLVLVGGSPWVAGAGAVLWGIGASLGFPVGMSAAADDPARAAARVSVVSSIGYTAFIGGPPLIGFLAQHAGLLHALWVVLAVLLLATVLASAAGSAPVVGAGSPHEEGVA